MNENCGYLLLISINGCFVSGSFDISSEPFSARITGQWRRYLYIQIFSVFAERGYRTGEGQSLLIAPSPLFDPRRPGRIWPTTKRIKVESAGYPATIWVRSPVLGAGNYDEPSPPRRYLYGRDKESPQDHAISVSRVVCSNGFHVSAANLNAHCSDDAETE